MKNGITHENLGIDVKEYSLEDISNIKELYVCFDFLCNLNCPHCTLKLIPFHHQFEKVYQSLEYLHSINKDFTINLFGGEPMILKDEDLKQFESLLKSHTFIISTNLLQTTLYKLELMTYAEDVNTSWNPQRFTNKQHEVWLKNLELLCQFKIRYSVMVTLTKDLIEQSPESFLERVLTWKNCRNIDLKQMIGDDSIDFNKVDEWLCKLYLIWKDEKPLNLLFKEMRQVVEGKKIWKNYCTGYFTLMPNGYLKNGCPYYEYTTPKDFCLYCNYYPICKGGCNIQERCTFPKKLYNLMREEYGKS